LHHPKFNYHYEFHQANFELFALIYHCGGFVSLVSVVSFRLFELSLGSKSEFHSLVVLKNKHHHDINPEGNLGFYVTGLIKLCKKITPPPSKKKKSLGLNPTKLQTISGQKN